MRPQLILTGPPFQEWNEHKKEIPRDRNSWPERISKLSRCARKSRAQITPIGLGIKGRGPDTTVDQSPTEKTTVNNKLSGTILKSRKMTNSQLPAQPSSATMDGKNSSFLRKDWHERSFSRGENHQLFQNFLFHPTYGIIFFLFKNHVCEGTYSLPKTETLVERKKIASINSRFFFNSIFC